MPRAGDAGAVEPWRRAAAWARHHGASEHVPVAITGGAPIGVADD